MLARNLLILALAVALFSLPLASTATAQPLFVRGDINCDGVVDMNDVNALQAFLFGGGSLACFDAADVDDNGALGVVDLTLLTNFVTTGVPAPSAPYPNCGFDPTPDNLTCQSPCCGVDKNHYKTWRLQPQGMPSLSVSVRDQFMFDIVTLTSIDYISNPAQKDTFNILLPNDHLTWYRARGRNTALTVEFYNQFGQDTVDIDSTSYLLVPTQKLPHPLPSPTLDHYKAYRIKNAQPFIRVTRLMDQFDPLPEIVDQLIPRYFLTPASKNDEPMHDSITHYVAYEFIPKTTLPTTRNTLDQFGQHTIFVASSELLLVPTYKLSVQTPPTPVDTLKNHFKSWRIEPPAPFSGMAAVKDQFKTDQLFLSEIEFLSNPAKKDTSDIRRPNDHLNWYKATGQSPTLLQVEFQNQFERDTVIIGNVTHLLVPCRKDPHPSPDSLLGHYTAYEIRNGDSYRRTAGPVTVQDQFDAGAPELIDSLIPRYFLTPAKKNNEPQYGSDTHYVAYEIYPKTQYPSLLPRLTQDQFGQHQLPVFRSELLLVPSHKIRWGPPPTNTEKNHYKGWKLDPLPWPTTAQVVDQFMSDVLKLDSIRYLANPAQKDNFPIVKPDDHLLWYSADGRDTCLRIVYENQFGLDTFVIGTVTHLILPAQKEPHPLPDPMLDHYKAYRVRNPQTFIRPTQLFDQFDVVPEQLDQLRPLYFCTPASKNGELIHDPVTHYVAYEIFPKDNSIINRITVDQFGTHPVRTQRSELLMVPTQKLNVRPFCVITVPGDVNCNDVVTSADIIGDVNYVFKGGLQPCPCPAAADADCNGVVTSADIIRMVNYVFKAGLPPCNPCTVIPALWICPC